MLLYEDLARLILDGTWLADQQIPSERELCEQYRVSRTTVRQALQMAEHRGLVVRVAGRGTFVAQPHIQAQLSVMIAFREAMYQQDVAPGFKLIRAEWISPSVGVSEALRLASGEKTLMVRWAPLGRGQPLGLFDSYLATSVAHAVERSLKAMPATSAPTYELAALALGIDTLVVDQTFDSNVAEVESATLLKIQPGAPVFTVTSIFKTSAGVPVEYNTAIFAAERYSLHMVRQLRLDTAGSAVWKTSSQT